MVACPTCDAANPDGARYCNACGAPVEAAAGLREERKTVTVLFADLAGFTARSETLDPEDVRAFLVPYYDLLTAEVERHGGQVDRFLGDGVMAIFGAPVAHEDDPERAVRAALRIVDRVPSLGHDLHVRVGINTGPVLFVAGNGGERDDAVTGDTVNTAARLQAVARADGVVVGEATWRATSHLFAFEALDPIVAKGKAEPVALWRPIRPLVRPVGDLRPEPTPFVGRGPELALLTSLFDRSRTTPSLEVVTVVADPGIGKSRLIRELARYADQCSDPVTWRTGRCLPYGDGIGFWPLGEIVKAQAGILDTDDQVAIAARLDAVLSEPDPALRAWMRDRIGPLVGLQVTTQPPQAEEAFTAWRRFLESLARVRPTVLVVEDLHWADDAMIAFLAHLAANAAGLPLMLVATARPEIEERHPSWLGRARRSTVISLAALPDREMAAIVEATVPAATGELVAAVLARAGGSPLFAVQLAAMLRERTPDALDEAAVPPTIAALLAARIDALAADAKAVLLDASVIGKAFWTGAVAALSGRERSVVEPVLADLVRRDLVRHVVPSSMAGDEEFAFVHALVRDVAYAALPRAARMTRHRAAATWIASGVGATRGETTEIVVAHLDRALELSKAGQATADIPALQAELVDALVKASDHAKETQPSRAVSQLRRALDLLVAGDVRRADILARLGRALLATFDYAGAATLLEEALSDFLGRGDATAVARIAVPLAIALGNAGDVGRAESILAQARAALGERRGPELVALLAQQAMHATVALRTDQAAELADAALRLSGELGMSPPHRALAARGIARFGSDPEGGEADLRLAIELAQADGDLRSSAVAYYNLAARRTDGLGSAAGLVDRPRGDRLLRDPRPADGGHAGRPGRDAARFGRLG